MTVTHKMAGADTLELSLVGVVGDGWAEEPITKELVRKAMKSAPKANLIKVHLDSFGGSYFEGLAIYQLLSENQARVEIEIGSCAASAASLIAMAGDSISMHDTSTMLVHEVWTMAMGKASDLRKEADDLDLLSGQAALAYSSRTEMDHDAVVSLMAEDRFMGAEECKRLGFCTEVRKAKPKGKANSAALTETYVRQQIAQIRKEAEGLSGTERLAASATPSVDGKSDHPEEPSTNNQEPLAIETTNAVALPPQETKHMTGIPALILAALSLSVNATEDDAVVSINKIKADAEAGKKLTSSVKASTTDEALGTIAALQANAAQTDGEGYVKVMAALGASSSDEALGTIAAFQAAKERLANTESKLATLEEKQTQGERDELITKLRAEGKVTPAQEKDMLPSMSLETLKAFSKTAVPVLKGDGKREPGSGKSYAGKKFADLTPSESRALHDEDPGTFDRLVAEYRAQQ